MEKTRIKEHYKELLHLHNYDTFRKSIQDTHYCGTQTWKGNKRNIH